ncbi:hypothetical protein ACXYUI_32250, partial [Klebsiella pneumoniae]
TTVLYNGETVAFANGETWDANGSTLTQSNLDPYSGSNHLRATLNLKNNWSAAAYDLNRNNTGVNFSGAQTLTLWMKAAS